MTAQERSMIDELVERIRTTPVADKDAEAEAYLKQTLGNVPDALYVLTQTVLVQQYGLTQAQAKLQALQDELESSKRERAEASQTSQKGGGSFLSRIFGEDERGTATPGTPAQANAPSGYQPVNYAPPAGVPSPPYGGQAYPAPPYGGGPQYGAPAYGMPGNFGGGGFGGGGGGFMRGALQTAAGVAAGALVFQGMEDLFRGFGGHESRGFGDMPNETVVNNYYGGDDQAGRDDRSLSANEGSGFYNPAQDASREGGDESRGFADASSDDTDSGDDGSASDFDDSGSDDDGESDDGGGFDDSGDSNY